VGTCTRIGKLVLHALGNDTGTGPRVRRSARQAREDSEPDSNKVTVTYDGEKTEDIYLNVEV